jgi:hypothetical protein
MITNKYLMKLKFFLLYFILIISMNSFCQLGPTIGGDLSSGNNYKGTSLFFSAINATMTTLNIVNFNKEGKSKENAGFGILTGICQISYGLIYKNDCPASDRNVYLPLNVGLGLITVLTSVGRLFTKEAKKDKLTSLNLLYIPNNNKSIGIGFSLTRKL